MKKIRNSRHSFPDVAERKTVKARRVRLRPYGLTHIRSIYKRAAVAFA